MALREIQVSTVISAIKISKDDIISEMLKNQRQNGIDKDKILHVSDMIRISKHVEYSIFNDDVCAIWTGYITNFNNPNKGTYINFYFRKQKVALHRLLFHNFCGNLNTTEYLKFKCQNKGYCCSIKCLSKHKYFISGNTTNIQHKKIKPIDVNPSDILDNIHNSNLFVHFN